jgi:hypothetical protein
VKAQARNAARLATALPTDLDPLALPVPRGVGDAAFSEHVLLHLAVLCQGKAVEELDVARDGEVGELRFAMPDGLDGLEGFAVLKDRTP